MNERAEARRFLYKPRALLKNVDVILMALCYQDGTRLLYLWHRKYDFLFGPLRSWKDSNLCVIMSHASSIQERDQKKKERKKERKLWLRYENTQKHSWIMTSTAPHINTPRHPPPLITSVSNGLIIQESKYRPRDLRHTTKRRSAALH